MSEGGGCRRFAGSSDAQRGTERARRTVPSRLMPRAPAQARSRGRTTRAREWRRLLCLLGVPLGRARSAGRRCNSHPVHRRLVGPPPRLLQPRTCDDLLLSGTCEWACRGEDSCCRCRDAAAAGHARPPSGPASTLPRASRVTAQHERKRNQWMSICRRRQGQGQEGKGGLACAQLCSCSGRRTHERVAGAPRSAPHGSSCRAGRGRRGGRRHAGARLSTPATAL